MNRKNIGSNFDKFLAEEVNLEEATSIAAKRVAAWQAGMDDESEPGNEGDAM